MRIKTSPQAVFLQLSLLVSLLCCGAAGATSVADFGIDELVRYSHAGLRVKVRQAFDVDEQWRRYVVDIQDVVFGETAGPSLELDLLRTVDGMPRLSAGDEVVVFVNFDNRVEKIIGLRWGTYRVENGRVLDYDRMPIELRSETRAGRSADYLRPAGGERSASLPYSELKHRVVQVRSRLAAGRSRPDRLHTPARSR